MEIPRLVRQYFYIETAPTTLFVSPESVSQYHLFRVYTTKNNLLILKVIARVR